MTTMPVKYLWAIVTLCSANGAAAEETDTIVVLGETLPSPPGTPAYGSVTIDRDRLIDNASGRLENILTDIAGFQQFRRSDSRSANPSAQGATLRALGGNAASRTLVLLDGVPVADPFFGFVPYSALAPERLSYVRVTRGGGVGAFGAGAVAGTIELGSATRADLPLSSIDASYGARDSLQLSAAFSPRLGNGFVSVTARWDRGDGFWTTPESQRVSASVPAAYESWSTSLRAVAPVAPDLELQANFTLFRDRRTLRLAGADSFSEGQDASLRLLARGNWQVDALAYLQVRDFGNIVISAVNFRKSLDQLKTPSTGVGGKIEIRPPLGPAHVLRLGLDTRFTSGEMFEIPYNTATGLATARRRAGGNQHTTGVFIEDDWTLGSLTLTGGARADNWTIRDGFNHSAAATGPITHTTYDDRSAWQSSFRFGALARIAGGAELRTTAYTGFRLPTLNELYRSFVVFPITTQANPGLDVEKLKGIEAGLDLSPLRRMRVSVTAFHNQLDGAIANVTVNANTRRRQNVDSITSRGIELNASATWQNVELWASYAYNDSKVKAPGQPFNGLRPAQSAAHSGSLTVGWTPKEGFRLSATARYLGRQYEDDLQADTLPSAWTIDGTASIPINARISILSRVENLFNKAVYTRNSGGSIDLGTPRTMWIGLKLQP